MKFSISLFLSHHKYLYCDIVNQTTCITVTASSNKGLLQLVENILVFRQNIFSFRYPVRYSSEFIVLYKSITVPNYSLLEYQCYVIEWICTLLYLSSSIPGWSVEQDLHWLTGIGFKQFVWFLHLVCIQYVTKSHSQCCLTVNITTLHISQGMVNKFH